MKNGECVLVVQHVSRVPDGQVGGVGVVLQDVIVSRMLRTTETILTVTGTTVGEMGIREVRLGSTNGKDQLEVVSDEVLTGQEDYRVSKLPVNINKRGEVRGADFVKNLPDGGYVRLRLNKPLKFE